MKIIRPDSFERRAEKGELYIRVDENTVSFSTQIVFDMNLSKADCIAFGQDGDDVFMFKAKDEKDGFKLRGTDKSSLTFSMKPFATWLLKFYGLYDLIKNSDDFKHHKFPLELTKDDGIYRLIPPLKYLAPIKEEKASSNGVLEKA